MWDNPLDTFTSGKSLNDSPEPAKIFASTPKFGTSTQGPSESESEKIIQDNNDYMSEDPDDVKTQNSPYEWISNMVPFGHPNLGGRHLLNLRFDIL